MPLVDSLAFAEREQVEAVVVVRDEDEPRTHGLAVDREPLPAAPVLHGQRERTQAGECFAAAAAVLAPVDEPRVEAERDVVQEEPVADPRHVDPSLFPVEGRERADRIAAVEAEVPGEVVAGPERDADERNVLLDRHLGDRRERAVPARHPQHVSVCAPCDLLQVVSLREEVHVDAALPRSVAELLGAGRAGA